MTSVDENDLTYFSWKLKIIETAFEKILKQKLKARSHTNWSHLGILAYSKSNENNIHKESRNLSETLFRTVARKSIIMNQKKTMHKFLQHKIG